MLGSLLRPVRACGPLAGSPWRAVGVSVGRAVLEWSSAGASSGRRVLTMAASLWRAPVLARVAVCGSPPMMTIPDLPPGVAEGGRRGPRRRPPRVRCVRPTERRRRRRSLAGCPSQQRGSRRGSRSTRPPKRHANTCQNTVREMECSALSWGSPSRTITVTWRVPLGHAGVSRPRVLAGWNVAVRWGRMGTGVQVKTKLYTMQKGKTRRSIRKKMGERGTVNRTLLLTRPGASSPRTSRSWAAQCRR